MQSVLGLGPLPAVEMLPVFFRRGVEESAELVPEFRIEAAVYIGTYRSFVREVYGIIDLLQDIVFLFSEPMLISVPTHS